MVRSATVRHGTHDAHGGVSGACSVMGGFEPVDAVEACGDPNRASSVGTNRNGNDAAAQGRASSRGGAARVVFLVEPVRRGASGRVATCRVHTDLVHIILAHHNSPGLLQLHNWPDSLILRVPEELNPLIHFQSNCGDVAFDLGVRLDTKGYAIQDTPLLSSRPPFCRGTGGLQQHILVE